MQSSDEETTRGGIAAWLDHGRGHAHVRDIGVQVEVCSLQSQRLTDAHPCTKQQRHVVLVGRSPGTTQQQTVLVASNIALMGSRQPK